MLTINNPSSKEIRIPYYGTSKKILAGAVPLLVLFILVVPFFTSAKLVTCDGPDCDFDKFIEMINGIINWIIGIATVIFTISAVWGGFLYVTSGMNPGNKEKAKGILWNTLIGFVIILVGWVIVYTILYALVPENSTVFNFLKK